MFLILENYANSVRMLDENVNKRFPFPPSTRYFGLATLLKLIAILAQVDLFYALTLVGDRTLFFIFFDIALTFRNRVAQIVFYPEIRRENPLKTKCSSNVRHK